MNKEHHKSPATAILAIPVIVAVILTMFAWPAAKVGPRDLPIGVAGPSAAADGIERKLEAQGGGFDVERYADEAAAREAIEDREVYGAFVATPSGPKVLTASAASSAVAQLLQHAAAANGAATEDVVVASRGAGALPSSVLPLVLAGLLTGIAAATLATGVWARAGLLLTGAGLAGIVSNTIIQSWLDVIGGDWWANAAALSLLVFAIGATVAGLKALFGAAGAALAAVAMIFVGNPFSGVGTSPDLLPDAAGGIGRLLPPGAGGNLLRSTGFFDGAASGGYIAVLATWALAGLALLVVAAVRGRRGVSTADPVAVA